MKKAVLAIDQGTTGTRALLYDARGKLLASSYREFTQYFPRPGWVEHDPEEIWKTTLEVIQQSIKSSRVPASQIGAIGITNQRETTILWSRKTGRPVHRAIVWQDRRTAADCDSLKRRRLEKIFRKRTGLVLDPYFSGTKISWLLNHLKGLKAKARKGEILFGTIDTWLLWKLTGGRAHATDFTNASRTLVFNIHTKKWDHTLLRLLGIPHQMMPEVKDSASQFGVTEKFGSLPAGIPIRAMMGDQQAALYGQGCYDSGQAKNTYGTGCFLMANSGRRCPKPAFGLLTTLACDENGKSVYALEGAIFIAGAAMQWLRDGLGFFKKASQSENLIRKLKDSGGVTMVPAFAGLGSPYWDAHARGMISGITRGTTRAHIIRAALESIAHQSADALEMIQKHAHFRLKTLKVDGGATHNRFLMQFQADLLGIPVYVSDISESTAWGAAKLAGYASGIWPSLKQLDVKRRYAKFTPKRRHDEVRIMRLAWKREINRVRA